MWENLRFSHKLMHTGEHLGLYTVEELLTPWLVLMSHTPAAKSVWLEITGTAMKGYSRIRWWSRWEIHGAARRELPLI